ncbi:DEAD/DEAH box helicase [Corynebacterium alimapuense]|uniref:Helicase n=1 Tax=Corynebacterium alimapuense TaxID=1576874 RepID=A0A3M8K789_9CORY|nr:DEAD/DEAH box helicase [Corynebacterium alimapuense]RNE48432.1 hypothetical protein C5L39_07940 [Corynebacterium alimapuense]
MQDWNDPDLELLNLVDEYRNRCVEVYRNDSNRIEEDAQKEASIAEGGYGRKQIQELIQNAADAMHGSKGKIEVLLTPKALYVANEGNPFVDEGVRALLYHHLSDKKGDEIGRFGLGFKSISGVSDGPMILSRSASFQFGRSKTAEFLKDQLGYEWDKSAVPALRIAWTVNPAEAFLDDDTLRSLSKWATTIVKVPIKDGALDGLESELDDFDQSFCLFVPHVTELRLTSTRKNSDKRYQTKTSGKRVFLVDAAGRKSTWVVVHKDHVPSREALNSAGQSARRDSITVSWAVPLDGGAGTGRLSAYFPVKSELSLSGYINAPWKLSDDRINVIEGKFNSEILTEVVPQLVVDARSELISGNPTAKDNDEKRFGRYLDVLPARGREAKSWADREINKPIYQALREVRSLPNAAEELRTPQGLKMLPAVIPDRLQADWIEHAVDKEGWLHPQCSSNRDRRSKVVRLMTKDDRERTKEEEGRFSKSITTWLESFIDAEARTPDPNQSLRALGYAALLLGEVDPSEEDCEAAIQESNIVLLEIGIYVQPIAGRCFIRNSSEDSAPGIIDPRVTDVQDGYIALKILGISDYAQTGKLMETLSELKTTAVGINWENLWAVLRQSDLEDIKEAFNELFNGKQSHVVRIKNGKGEWVLPASHYIPGKVIQNIVADYEYLVDSKFHAADHSVLDLLGIQDHPFRSQHENTKWLTEYKKEHRQAAGLEMKIVRPEWENIDFNESPLLLGPLDNFTKLSDTNRAAITQHILHSSTHPWVTPSYKTRRSSPILQPEYWLVKKYGLLQTTLEFAPIEKCFVIDDDDQDIRDIVPVITNLDLTDDMKDALGYHLNMEELSQDEFTELVETHVKRDNELAVGKSYSWWCYMSRDTGFVPSHIHVQDSGTWVLLDPKTVAVTADHEKEEEFEKLGIPTLKVSSPDDSKELSDNWKLMDGSTIPIEFEYRTGGEAQSLQFRYPSLSTLEIDRIEELSVQPCESIEMTTAIEGRPKSRIPVEYGRNGNTILSTGATESEELIQILQSLECNSEPDTVEYLLETTHANRNSKVRTRARNASSDAERLFLIAGEDHLYSLISNSAIEFLKRTNGQEPKGIHLAEVCIKMLGVNALRKACEQAKGSLQVGPPPGTWNGSHAARKWVRDLGFDEVWAGNKHVEKSKPTDYVDGPIEAETFHDYQQKVSDNLYKMLDGDGPNRGLVTLPTGAGKTRVAVQTIIEAIKNDCFSGPVLWLVDSAELCEQAIDAWAFLWRSSGSIGTRLSISRHWKNYSATEETSGVQVIVATWQKMLHTLDKEEYGWLQEAPLLVIDEAHTALSPSYTKILKWAGLTHTKRNKLLLGLTATPFRGRQDSDETTRLRNRFDNNMLDAGVFGDENPMKYLQRVEVLSHVTMETIRSDNFVSLTPAEIHDFKSLNWLPKSKEQELGQDLVRTQQIIDSIKSKPQEWSILVFATSVANAETLATLLTLEGIPSASINANTSQTDRELAVDRFKKGEIRVLTNYSVLTQGFDAPKTEAVYITRPTSSEVLYQQMIGRGLRGPKNGGTEHVHIVNLLDNITEFDLSINYKSFERLTDKGILDESI